MTSYMTPSIFKQLNNQNGSILVTVLTVLSILLTIFVFALTYTLTRYSFHTKDKNNFIATHLSEAGIQNGVNKLNNNNFVSNYKYKTENNGTISVSKELWGPFYLISSIGQFANQKIKTTSIIGSYPDSIFSDAITACDERYPFIVAGNTRIFGNVNTGLLGMETGQIRGEAVTSKQYHQGKINIHQDLSTPLIDTTVLDGYFNEMLSRKSNCKTFESASLYLNKSSDDLFKKSNAIEIENNLEMNHFFFESNSEIHSLFVNGFVEIKNSCKISSLLEIIAEGPIYIKDSSVLDNVILYSKDSIIIEDDATFSGIAIAHKKIIVKDKAKLLYPSMLLLLPLEKKEHTENGIYLTSKNQLETICYLSNNKEDSTYMRDVIYLDTVSTIVGAVISNQLVDLRGSVYGSIVTEQFKYEQPPTTYIHWAKSLYVNRTVFDLNFGLPMFQYNRNFQRHNIIRHAKESL